MTPRPVRPRVPPPRGLADRSAPPEDADSSARVRPEDPSGDDVITLDPSTAPAPLFRRRARQALARRLSQAPGLTDAAMAEIFHAFLGAVSQAEALIKAATVKISDKETKHEATTPPRTESEAATQSPARP